MHILKASQAITIVWAWLCMSLVDQNWPSIVLITSILYNSIMGETLIKNSLAIVCLVGHVSRRSKLTVDYTHCVMFVQFHNGWDFHKNSLTIVWAWSGMSLVDQNWPYIVLIVSCLYNSIMGETLIKNSLTIVYTWLGMHVYLPGISCFQFRRPLFQPERSARWGRQLEWPSQPATLGSSPGTRTWGGYQQWGHCWPRGPHCWRAWWSAWLHDNLGRPTSKRNV